MRVPIADTNGNSYCNCHGDSDRHVHAYRNSYRDGNSHGDGNSYRDSNTHGNRYCDRTAAAYAHATASAYTAATSLALSGIKGTRENQPASSQLQSCSKSLTTAGPSPYKGAVCIFGFPETKHLWSSGQPPDHGSSVSTPEECASENRNLI